MFSQWGTYFAIHCQTPAEWDQVTQLLNWSWNYGSWENNQAESVILVQEVKGEIHINTCNLYWMEPSPKLTILATEFIRAVKLQSLEL